MLNDTGNLVKSFMTVQFSLTVVLLYDRQFMISEMNLVFN